MSNNLRNTLLIAPNTISFVLSIKLVAEARLRARRSWRLNGGRNKKPSGLRRPRQPRLKKPRQQHRKSASLTRCRPTRPRPKRSWPRPWPARTCRRGRRPAGSCPCSPTSTSTRRRTVSPRTSLWLGQLCIPPFFGLAFRLVTTRLVNIEPCASLSFYYSHPYIHPSVRLSVFITSMFLI